ncbi:MarR family transcriptional regulator [Bosea sp. 124]|uniref:MarR family winged helix-turn-helix transcriptional regulator n=1 Tax=Bosea sp. 124 TaxID=2135642 RepID=UPI000D46D430|nr:MarR family transcriptional regulator [Bosea sp. 124]PTM39789.1 MarR family transcriptional regulator [Bosea sp. 124]
MKTRPLRREMIFQLVETARLMRGHIDQRARQRGTTRAQWGVLSRLRRNEGMRQAELADILDIQPISVTRMIDRLAQQNLVERRPDPSDRRAHRLYLTSEGLALVDDLDPLRQDIADHLLAMVDDTTIATMLAGLASIRERARPTDSETLPAIETAA